MKKLAALILIMQLMGCAASGPAFKKAEIKKDEAIVYVYREDAYYQALASPPIYINGKRLVYLSNGKYACKAISPGSYEVSVKKDMMYNSYGSDETLKIDVEAGKSYYIKLGFGEMSFSPTGSPITPVTGSASNYLALMPNEVAIEEISQCKLDVQ